MARARRHCQREGEGEGVLLSSGRGLWQGRVVIVGERVRVRACCHQGEGDGEDDGEGTSSSETRMRRHHRPCRLVNLVLLSSFELASSSG